MEVDNRKTVDGLRQGGGYACILYLAIVLKSAVHSLELSIARGVRGEKASSPFVSGQRRQHLHRECQDATTITFHLCTSTTPQFHGSLYSWTTLGTV